jgi:hypothetical protein
MESIFDLITKTRHMLTVVSTHAFGILLLLVVICSGQTMAQQRQAPVRDGARTFQKPVQNWLARRNRNILMQQRDYSCGAAVLGTMLRYYWNDPVTEDQLINDIRGMLNAEELMDRFENGLSITDIRRLAVKRGYLSSIGKLTFKKLTETKIPVIVGIITRGYDHFVIFRGFDGEWVYLADPSRGNIRVPAQQFIDEWQQNTVLAVIRRGSEPRTWSPLHVRRDEQVIGATNWQVIRTTPTRSFRSPAAP